MSERHFEELLQQSGETYNRPPEPPRERIWARIQAARSIDHETEPRAVRAPGDQHPDRSTLSELLLPVLRLRSARLAGPIGVAAVLLIGILIGRMLPAEQQGQRTAAKGWNPAAGAEAIVHERPHSAALLSHAVAPYLGRVETLLTLIDSDGSDSPSTVPVTGWAEELLAETRLLRNSPARDDEELQLLLDDLELVLVRIVRLSDPQHVAAQQWIRDGIRDRSLLLRLRGRVPAEQIGGGA